MFTLDRHTADGYTVVSCEDCGERLRYLFQYPDPFSDASEGEIEQYLRDHISYVCQDADERHVNCEGPNV